MNITTTERGWPAHYICAADCLFRRNTLVEATNGHGETSRFVVSTVGNYRFGSERKLETIGHKRHYETMVFRARLEGVYWDADTSSEISLGRNCSLEVTRKNRDEIDNTANAMHEANVAALIEHIKEGKVA